MSFWRCDVKPYASIANVETVWQRASHDKYLMRGEHTRLWINWADSAKLPRLNYNAHPHKIHPYITKSCIALQVHDINLIRVSISYERINKSVIEESWNILKNLVDEFTNRKSPIFIMKEREMWLETIVC